MKVKYKGETSFLIATKEKIYDVLSVEKGWYRIVDDSGADYLYPPEMFDIVVEEYILCHKGAYMGKNGITRDRTGKPWYYRNLKR